MDNRIAGCHPPVGATPLLRFGLPSPPGVVGMVMAPGIASGKRPFYVVCKCGLGCCVCGGHRCWRWVLGLWALGDAPRACLVCGRRWLCVGEVPMWFQSNLKDMGIAVGPHKEPKKHVHPGFYPPSGSQKQQHRIEITFGRSPK